MRAAIVTAALALLLPAISRADPSTGTIRICRWPGISSPGDHQTVIIPAGSEFGDETGRGDTLATTERAAMGPAPKCAIVGARVTDVPRRRHAPPLNGRTLLVAKFDTVNELQAQVASGFR